MGVRWMKRLAPFSSQIKCFLCPLLLSFIPKRTVLTSLRSWRTSGFHKLLPIAVTALLPIVLFPFFGVATAKDTSSVYFSDSNVLFFGSMVLAVAVEASNFHERVALRILLLTGPNPRRLLLGFMSATSVLSTRPPPPLMVPIVVAVIRELESCRANDLEGQVEPLEAHDVGNEDGTLDLSGVPKERVDIYKALLLSTCFTASSAGTIMLTATGANIVLSGFMEDRYGNAQPITFASWILYSLPISGLLVVVTYFWLIVLFIGFKSFDDSQSHLIINLLRKKYGMLGPIRYIEKNLMVVFVVIVLLWLFRDPKVIWGWGNIFLDGYVSDGTVALVVCLALFIMPAENPFTYDSKQRMPTIMNWSHMSKFSWSTFLLLGGGYGIARVERSGLSDLLSHWLATFNHLPDWTMILLSGILVTFLTEFSSNITTASVFIPMMDNMARARHANPLLFILPAKAGVVLNIVGFALTQLLTISYGDWIFGLNSYPNWANHNATMA
ncbi:Sodium/sulfate symporter family-containing protein [Aphelenchoides fujianensis]|nr:Sodium/sulfate symporter family-containing protein [Aphelenchoides fujianensis]